MLQVPTKERPLNRLQCQASKEKKIGVDSHKKFINNKTKPLKRIKLYKKDKSCKDEKYTGSLDPICCLVDLKFFIMIANNSC